jgi:phage/plasmid primase-like uncharacterized protein
MTPAEQFRDAIRALGMEPPAVIKPGMFYRFPGIGKRNGNDAGWCKLFADERGGIFGDFSSGLSESWQPEQAQALTRDERENFRRLVEQGRAEVEYERSHEQARAARKARAIWNVASPASPDTPYLFRKGVAPVRSLGEIGAGRVAELLGYSPKSRGEPLTGRLLVVPIKVGGKLSTLELIDGKGRKSAIAGGAKRGGFWSAQRLPEGDGAGITILIAEGVATALSARAATGHAAVAALSCGNLEAVAKWLRHRHPAARLVVLADLVKATGQPDPHAIEAARSCGAFLAFPDFGDDRPSDATDFNDLARHRGAEVVAGAVAIARAPEVSEAQPEAQSAAASDVCAVDTAVLIDACEKKASQAGQLVQLALQLFEIARSDLDEAFALRRDGSRVALMFRGSRDALRATLAREFRRRTGITPRGAALADALTALQGEALEAPPRAVHLRVAEHDGGMVLDLGRQDGQAVFVGPRGWELPERAPVIFRRTVLTSELPIPQRGGNVDELRKLLNVTANTWPLVLGWLVATLLPSMPHPILMLGGEQGSGKTTAARNLSRLVDPSPAPVRSQPHDTEAWAMAAAGSWIVPIDNVSSIPGWWSDCLCKAVTGDGFVRRKLYTDSELAVLAFRRAIVLTSIDAGALRGDLGDRILLVDLEPIPECRRRSEVELEQVFQHLHAQLLGALLDLLAGVVAELPRVTLQELPRMADFARALAALDAVCGTHAIGVYVAQRDRVVSEVLDSDSVAVAIQALGLSKPWTGTQGDLLKLLTPAEAPRPHDWPKNPRALTARLRRLVPALRQSGVLIEIPKDGRSARGRVISIRRKEMTAAQPSQQSLPSLSEGKEGDDRCDDRRDSGDGRVDQRSGRGSGRQGQSDCRDDCDGHSGHLSNAGEEF